MTLASPWQLDKQVAQLRWGERRAAIDLSAPHRGLRVECAGGEFELLGVDLIDAEPAVCDLFVRGADLAVTYEQTSARPARVQIYWRLLHAIAPDELAIEAIVSVQTSLLDSWPSLRTSSRLPAGEVMRLVETSPPRAVALPDAEMLSLRREDDAGTACLGFALADRSQGYIEMLHPGDFWRGSVERNASERLCVRCAWELFPQHLEKGVILRARLRGVLLPTPPDAKALARHYGEFLAEPLPLTV